MRNVYEFGFRRRNTTITMMMTSMIGRVDRVMFRKIHLDLFFDF